MNLDNFFNPKTVAVIGASDNPNKVGFALMKNLLIGRKRKIYPITLTNPEIPEGIDLALIAVRADLVPKVLTECGEKKIPAAIIIAAGFREIGDAGKAREEEIVAIARKYHIALLGPNCLGVINTATNLNASFSAKKPQAGSIAFLSQSGALGTALIDAALDQGIGFSKFVSLGNEAILTELDFLKFLAQDETTKALLIYLEHLTKGPEFFRLVTAITKTKPVVILRAGRSRRGRQAALSHTGSLAPANAVFSAACRQSGAIEVSSIREFFNLAKLFQLEIYQPLKRLVVLTNGGGPSVIAADLIDLSHSLMLAELSSATQEALRQVLPTMAAIGNPVDIIGDALSDRYRETLKILIKEPAGEGIILMLTPQMMTEVEATAKLVTEYRAQKPIIPVFLGGPTTTPGLDYLRRNNLPNFPFPQDAIEALDALARSAKKPEAGGSLEVAPPNLLRPLNFSETTKILNEYQISLSGFLARNKEELPQIFSRLNPPLAIKAISSDLIHKTEAGAVKLNLPSAVEAETAWNDIVARNPKAKIEGLLIQPMTTGHEVIIGMKRDATFGPTILFGLGGIFTEVFQDTSLRLAPVSKEDALAMIQEIRGIKILAGQRGAAAVNFEMLAALIVNLSNLALAHPEIQEIDLNPVMVTATSATIVDVRVMV